MSRCGDCPPWVKEKCPENLPSSECIDKLQDMLWDEQKSGEWIDKGWHGDWQYETDGRGNCWKEFECSNCHYISLIRTSFCPSCRKMMKGESDV